MVELGFGFMVMFVAGYFSIKKYSLNNALGKSTNGLAVGLALVELILVVTAIYIGVTIGWVSGVSIIGGGVVGWFIGMSTYSIIYAEQLINSIK